jgi:hypothetical protein
VGVGGLGGREWVWKSGGLQALATTSLAPGICAGAGVFCKHACGPHPVGLQARPLHVRQRLQRSRDVATLLQTARRGSGVALGADGQHHARHLSRITGSRAALSFADLEAQEQRVGLLQGDCRHRRLGSTPPALTGR